MNPGDIQPGRARDGGASPDRYTSSMSEARRKGLIFYRLSPKRARSHRRRTLFGSSAPGSACGGFGRLKQARQPRGAQWFPDSRHAASARHGVSSSRGAHTEPDGEGDRATRGTADGVNCEKSGSDRATCMGSFVALKSKPSRMNEPITNKSAPAKNEKAPTAFAAGA